MESKRWTLWDRQQQLAVPPDWQVDQRSVGSEQPFQIRLKQYQIGLSAGVWALEMDNGPLQLEILPTRGMSLHRAVCDSLELGWKSPVHGPVHPSWVSLSEPGGLGWLDGFDELMVRCGLESNGAPDFDADGRLLYPLHGRIGNRPAEQLEVAFDAQANELLITGVVTESRFHFAKLQLTSTLRCPLGGTSLHWQDQVRNLSASPAPIQLLYHVNFGLPLLDAGSRVVVPARNVVPRNEHAAASVASWDHYAAEQAGFEEQVYFCDCYSDADHRTEVLLKNAHGTRGVSLNYDTRSLPCFSLWKNTTAAEDGYVTGLEPGTNFPNPRSFEGRQGREILLNGGASCAFDVQLQCYGQASDVERCESRIARLATAEPKVHPQPLPDWCA